MPNILSAAEAASILRTEATDSAMLTLLPQVDAYIQSATGRDWTADAPAHPAAKAAAGMLLVTWFDNPSQMGADTPLAFGLNAVLTQLEAEALKYRKYQIYGRDLVGAISLAGALVGDEVISVTGIYGAAGSQDDKFETVITV